MAAPIPRELPVTMATFPARGLLLLLLFDDIVLVGCSCGLLLLVVESFEDVFFVMKDKVEASS